MGTERNVWKRYSRAGNKRGRATAQSQPASLVVGHSTGQDTFPMGLNFGEDASFEATMSKFAEFFGPRTVNAVKSCDLPNSIIYLLIMK